MLLGEGRDPGGHKGHNVCSHTGQAGHQGWVSGSLSWRSGRPRILPGDILGIPHLGPLEPTSHTLP